MKSRITQTPHRAKLLTTSQRRFDQLYHVLDEETPKHGKHGEVLFAITPNKGRTYAIKNQRKCDEKASREYEILKALTKHKVPNFVKLEGAFQVEDDLNLVLTFADAGTLKERLSKSKKKKSENSPLTLSEYKSVLFQILYALWCAQDVCEFVHCDLHLDNVLLQRLPDSKKFCVYSHGEKKWFTNGYLVLLADFGLSRATLDNGKVIKNAHNSQFSPDADIKNLHAHLKNVSISNWGDLSPHEHLDESEAPELKRISLSLEGTHISPTAADTTKVAEHQKKLHRSLRQKMGSQIGVSPRELLDHEFFDSLLSPVDQHQLKSDQLIFITDSENAKAIGSIVPTPRRNNVFIDSTLASPSPFVKKGRSVLTAVNTTSAITTTTTTANNNKNSNNGVTNMEISPIKPIKLLDDDEGSNLKNTAANAQSLPLVMEDLISKPEVTLETEGIDKENMQPHQVDDVTTTTTITTTTTTMSTSSSSSSHVLRRRRRIQGPRTLLNRIY